MPPPRNVDTLLAMVQRSIVTAPPREPLLIRIAPPPLVPPTGLPLVKVIPEIETAAAPALMLKMRDTLLPLMVRALAPGPLMLIAWVIGSSPLVKTIEVT